MASAVPAGCQTGPGGEKVPELGEEDLVTVSYMGDELDLETVGDIIAIIEDKVPPVWGGKAIFPQRRSG